MIVVLLIVVVLFGCAAFGVRPPHPRVSYGWLGLFVAALWQLVTTLPASLT